jgi:hypothetical protein
VRLSSLSTEYVRVPVAAEEDGAAVDPTAATVEFAFPADGTAPSSWETGEWETDSRTNPATYYARILVGAGDLDLAAGDYDVWVRVTLSPEVATHQAGTLTIV